MICSLFINGYKVGIDLLLLRPAWIQKFNAWDDAIGGDH